ncbi:hypothetical protein [Streptomyces sp. NRRL S-1813]|uniref:hypothetical protein n=1 Tax=Streptomyces sp. NRRL S-1813 TaxID=1463888 RepID=UPI001F2DB4BE|nr:hypothetical protein [Streptomyces sp. NRRL S-1813]
MHATPLGHRRPPELGRCPAGGWARSLKSAAPQSRQPPAAETVITAAVPARPFDLAKTVNVTVAVGVAASPTGTADEFTYVG